MANLGLMPTALDSGDDYAGNAEPAVGWDDPVTRENVLTHGLETPGDAGQPDRSQWTRTPLRAASRGGWHPAHVLHRRCLAARPQSPNHRSSGEFKPDMALDAENITAVAVITDGPMDGDVDRATTP